MPTKGSFSSWVVPFVAPARKVHGKPLPCPSWGLLGKGLVRKHGKRRADARCLARVARTNFPRIPKKRQIAESRSLDCLVGPASPLSRFRRLVSSCPPPPPVASPKHPSAAFVLWPCATFAFVLAGGCRRRMPGAEGLRRRAGAVNSFGPLAFYAVR